VAKSGGSPKIAGELMAFGGERIYFRDIEAVEGGSRTGRTSHSGWR